MDEFDSRQARLSRYRRLLAATSDSATARALKAMIAELEVEGSKPAGRTILQAEQEQVNTNETPPGRSDD